jgi:Glycosyl transferase family 8
MRVCVVSHFDETYLPQGLAMMRSIRRNTSSNIQFLIVCHDDKSSSICSEELLKQGDVQSIVIGTEVLIESYSELKNVLISRPRIEYLFALTPFVIDYGMLITTADIVVYIDSDILFFNDISKALTPLEDNGYDTIFVEHRFKTSALIKQKYGKYNVGLVAFRRCSNSDSILSEWKIDCTNGTPATLRNGMFGDQLYLESISQKFNGIYSDRRVGHNEAPWNTSGEVHEICGKVKIRESDLIYYHFSGLRMGWFYAQSHFSSYGQAMSQSLRKKIYVPYAIEIRNIKKEKNLHKKSSRKIFRWRKFPIHVWNGDIYLF